MRITGIEGIAVSVPVRAPLLTCYGALAAYPRTIVFVHTDEGVTGLGEVSAAVTPDQLRRLGEAIHGFNPWELGRIRARLNNWGYFLRNPRAVGGIEIALLDLLGKATGKPMHELLGGALRESVPAAAYLFFTRPGEHADAIGSGEAMQAEARRWIAEHGVSVLKLKGGVLSPDEEADTLALLADLGPGLRLRIDPQGAWSPLTAARIGRRLEALPMEYYEDPVDGMRAMAEVRRQVRIPLATNMCVTTLEHIPAAIELGAVDVILSDPWYFGGLENTRTLDVITGTFGLSLGMHSGCELGIGLAAMLHLASVLPNLKAAIDSMHPHLSGDIVEPAGLELRDGAYAVPGGPGLGVELDEDQVARYAELHSANGVANRASDPRVLDEARPGWFPVLPTH